MTGITFLLDPAPLPASVIAQARRCLLDLIGIGWGGSILPLSRIVRDHAAEDLGGDLPLPFDGRTASPMGVALATGMTIDALDGHDGYNPAKGHAGCGVLAGLLALAPDDLPFEAFLDALARGYEVACRAAVSQHATCPDYHTSGAWVALAVAGLGARLRGADAEQTAHAIGIAEYHGPRSQMMRCIDHPTMLKDGSGQGAMIGVQAVQLAARGFTGAPALVLEGPAWRDLGTRWLIHEQYFKPYPVCRWAQPPVEAALSLRPSLRGPIERIEIETFHESIRLATRHPRTTEEAQYSTAFPVAVALARGSIGPKDISGTALSDPQILDLADRIIFRESAKANAVFPATRLARATITAGGEVHTSGWHRPRWDADSPPSTADLEDKFRATTDGILTRDRSRDILRDLSNAGSVRDLRSMLAPT